MAGCKETEWSENYDIDYPVSVISTISPLQQKIGEEVTITGKNLEDVVAVSLGNLRCDIKSKTNENLIFVVPKNAQKDFVTIENIYMRKFVFDQEVFTPVP